MSGRTLNIEKVNQSVGCQEIRKPEQGTICEKIDDVKSIASLIRRVAMKQAKDETN
jgi:hypothetical protein